MVSQIVKDEGPTITSSPGAYTLKDVIVGCKVYVRRPQEPPPHNERQAEVLSVRQAAHEYGQEAPTEADNLFYIHWVNFNKRLDQWVPGSLLVLTRELEWPRPKAPAPAKKEPSLLKKATKTAKQAKAAKRAAARTESPVPSPSTLKRKASALNDSQDTEMDDGDSEGDSDEDADGESFIETPQGPPTPGPDSSSKEQEIEKLRHGGSMSQSAHEISRVKNLSKLQIGKHQVEAWYFSPYPVEYAHAPVLYICEFCLSYFKSEKMFSRHHSRCTLLHPPGNEIYRHEDISVFEIDGRRQLTWCRNLSLLSKCFLDHKTLYYDVSPFLYYVMAKRDQHGCHTIGYFSKEKESAENYNVACILTLPQHQRFGYGKLLIEFSYELSKHENKLGSPEKPLSDLGLVGYLAYWFRTIVGLLLESDEEGITVDEIANRTSITPADIIYTITEKKMVRIQRNQYVICLTDAIKDEYAIALGKRKKQIHPEALIWRPPTFTRDQLRFLG